MSADRGRARGADEIGVIGLGRFGGEVAESLVRLGQEVLAVDGDPRVVQRWSEELTHVVQADGTDETAMIQLGMADCRRVVVAIGAAVEASVLTVLTLVELGVPEIWARATSARHAKILSSVGAHHVIFPEAAMGERVAHLIISRLLDFIEFGDDFAIAKTSTPTSLVGRTLADVDMTERYGVMVVGVKSPGQPFTWARPDMTLTADSILVVEGAIDQVQRFAGST